MDNPTANGIYDPRLGPVDSSQPCGTCQLSEHQCPGHIGTFSPLSLFCFTHLCSRLVLLCFVVVVVVVLLFFSCLKRNRSYRIGFAIIQSAQFSSFDVSVASQVFCLQQISRTFERDTQIYQNIGFFRERRFRWSIECPTYSIFFFFFLICHFVFCFSFINIYILNAAVWFVFVFVFCCLQHLVFFLMLSWSRTKRKMPRRCSTSDAVCRQTCQAPARCICRRAWRRRRAWATAIVMPSTTIATRCLRCCERICASQCARTAARRVQRWCAAPTTPRSSSSLSRTRP